MFPDRKKTTKLNMNPLIQGHSGNAPKTSRDVFSTSLGTNEDDAQSDLNPIAGVFDNLTTRISGPEVGHEKVKKGQKEVT